MSDDPLFPALRALPPARRPLGAYVVLGALLFATGALVGALLWGSA